MDIKPEHNTDNKPAEETLPSSTPHRSPWPAWMALVFAIAAWAALIWSNGYVALALAVLSAVSGFIGAFKVSAAIRRLAITAIIAAVVLIAVVSAYLVVLKIGLR